MSKITKKDGKLLVPDIVTVPYIEGNQIGSEVTALCHAFVDTAIHKAYKGKRSIEWLEFVAGQKGLEEVGEWLPEETINGFRNFLVGMIGPSSFPAEKDQSPVNMELYKKLDLYSSVQPIHWIEGIISPLKNPEKINVHVFRENIEKNFSSGKEKCGYASDNNFFYFLDSEMQVNNLRFSPDSSCGICNAFLESSERLVKTAIRYAIEHRLPSVTLIHKGNTKCLSEKAFRQWGYSIADSEFPDETFSIHIYEMLKKVWGDEVADEELGRALEKGKVVIKDVLVDTFLYDIVIHPENYSVVATLNFSGDRLVDFLLGMLGKCGFSPKASVNYESGAAIFEPVYGPVLPADADNVKNPSSLIFASVMLLEYLGWHEAALLIKDTMKDSLYGEKMMEDILSFKPANPFIWSKSFKDLLGRSFKNII